MCVHVCARLSACVCAVICVCVWLCPQEIKLSAGPKLQESIAKINAAYPAEAVRFSDPSYARELIAKLEEE